ncbi:MAG: hypothetical protein WCA08_09795 [Desulfoferrobacter sp.]
MDLAKADDFSGIMNVENVLGGFARCGVCRTEVLRYESFQVVLYY